MTTLTANDYQQFSLNEGKVEDIGERMQKKLDAVGLPTNLDGASVLDIGCDMGFWSALCLERGAGRVVGLDRGRIVDGSHVDLVTKNTRDIPGCEFYDIDVGDQWPATGSFDLALMMSMYHHVYAQVGEHEPIWFWLRRQLVVGAKVLWEGPFDLNDPVPVAHIPDEYKARYTPDDIFGAATRWFDVRYHGPAAHELHRHVFYLTAKPIEWELYAGEAQAGAGGASRAWSYKDSARINEFEYKTGVRCVPGSLNLTVDRPFDWDRGHFRMQLMDVADRSKGLDSEWLPRWARVVPVQCNNVPAFAFRFDGERYPDGFVELVSQHRLRDFVEADKYVQILR